LQIRLLASIVLFLGSYLPLSLILLVQDFRYALLSHDFCWNVFSNHSACVIPLAHPMMSLVALAVCFISFLGSLIGLSLTRPKLQINVAEVKYIPAELMNYTLPYIVAFMSIGYEETGKFLGFIVFLAWMFWITHKSGQILLNPLLTILGWRLYEIRYTFPGNSTVINGRALAKGSIEPAQSYPHIVIQDVVILDVRHP
jgi:hypothetical protein